MKTSIIVCAYTENRWEEMDISISSLHRQSRPPNQIILVIDHNPQLLKRAKLKWPQIDIVPNKYANGLSGSRNSGLDTATGEIIFFMDEDAYASEFWIEQMLQVYADPNVIGVGGAIVPQWRSNQPDWFPNEFNWVVGCSYVGLPEFGKQVRNLIGCNMSFRREVFDAVGRFRDGIGRIGTIPLGCEETELCIRINNFYPDKALIYEPQAVVFHFVPEQRGKFSYFRKRCFAEGVSKAAISQFVSHQDSISTEKKYVQTVLLKGVTNRIVYSIKHREWSGVRQAISIVIGFSTTVYGFVWGHFSQFTQIRPIKFAKGQL